MNIRLVHLERVLFFLLEGTQLTKNLMRMSVLLHTCAALGTGHFKGIVIVEITVSVNLFVWCIWSTSFSFAWNRKLFSLNKSWLVRPTWQRKQPMSRKHFSLYTASVVAPSRVKLWKSSGPLSIPALTFLLGCPVFTGCRVSLSGAIRLCPPPPPSPNPCRPISW